MGAEQFKVNIDHFVIMNVQISPLEFSRNNFTTNLLNRGFLPYFYVNGSTLYEKDELVFDKFEYVPAHQGIWLLDWRRCYGY